ncbi:hypothetical protein QFZ36_000651 [Pseudarthrobacter siccitolerans]|uniref:Uncharacterized protein n=2 Tax=Micrococcales TaxID=85006 RepID=A0ABU0PGK1_9MICC|nr:hypothetical protein [Pseudarthrobacter siccitolerans]MDQ0690737.1 hypothetical protein [Arthrobacter sp. W4I7]
MLTIVGKAGHEKGSIMTEQNLPDDELEVVEENDVLLDETPGAASSLELDPVTTGQPDSYPGAAENNPDRWQEDPLLQDEVSGEEEDFLSDQTLRDDMKATRDGAGNEQVPATTPTLGEAVADVDFGEEPTGLEADASDDQENFGGSPLSEFEPDDLDR